MFEISYGKKQQNLLNTTAAGTRFGYFDEPIVFDVYMKDRPKTIKLIITVSLNNDKPKLHYEGGFKNQEQSEYYISFYNPNVPGQSGLKGPVATIFNKEGFLLGFMFWIETMADSKAYRLTYEFYDDRVPIETLEKVPQSQREANEVI
jgi:hypothetical protein